MKKKTCVLCMLVMALVLTGCISKMSETCETKTGDTVEITLDTSDGFFLDEADEYGFIVTKDDTIILQGAFLDEADFEDNKDALDYALDNGSAKMIEEDSANGILWTFYQIDASDETGIQSTGCFLVWIEGSSTGILIGTRSSEDTDVAKTVFDSLTFFVK